MYSLLRDVNKKEGATVIMVTHDLVRGAATATHLLELDGGQKYFGEGRLWPGRAQYRSVEK